MVMQNTYQSSKKSDCILKFDLKGSTIARNVKNITSDAAQVQLSRAKSEADFFNFVQTERTLKDVNFINLNRILKSIQSRNNRSSEFEDPEGIIRIKEEDLQTLIASLDSDTEFLKGLDIMDYSLYVVVEHLKDPLPHSLKKGFNSSDQAETANILLSNQTARTRKSKQNLSPRRMAT